MDDFSAMFAERQKGALPGHMGLEWQAVQNGRAAARFVVQAHHMAPNGFLHAASVVALLDSACGAGSFVSRPDGATGFTTIEIKTNFLGTGQLGDTIGCEARLVHGGRNTQVWDAEAISQTSGKPIALFRCTQMMLYPKA